MIFHVSHDYHSTLWKFNITMENHHFSWENPLFLWPFSMAMLVYQRVYSHSYPMKIFPSDDVIRIKLQVPLRWLWRRPRARYGGLGAGGVRLGGHGLGASAGARGRQRGRAGGRHLGASPPLPGKKPWLKWWETGAPQ